MRITQKLLRQKFRYFPKTGNLVWRHLPKNAFPNARLYGKHRKKLAGRKAGAICKRFGYVILNIGGRPQRVHRLIWLYVHGEFPSPGVDHINGIRHDNRLKNLRSANHAENNKNAKRCSTNTSGTTGVSFCKQTSKWRASISVNNKAINLGRYPEKSEAIMARRAAAAEYGFHKNHGRIA